MIHLNDSVYVCKEVFDENSEPTKTEIEEQASRLGIDPVKELHLLSIAKQCLLEPLPFDWFPCYIEKYNTFFYYNKESKTSQWEHPLDEYYRQIVDRTRSEDSSTGQDISSNVILDEDNLLDTKMYHIKNNNYEKKNVSEKRTVRFKNPIEESLDHNNSEENIKFLGPIKLNTPHSSTSSTLQNLPQFSTNTTFDARSTASRNIFSKYNILPNKDELSRKHDFGENIKKINDDPIVSAVNIFSAGKENMRKIDITLTESSDRSESTSSEICTDNLNSDYKKNDLKEKDNIITTNQMNKHQERNNNFNDDRSADSDNINQFQSTGTTATQLQYNNNVKKDNLIGDNINFIAKDSKIIESSMTVNSFSATKNKMVEIAQRFPLNQFTNTNTNETKLLKTKSAMESNERIFDASIKSNSYKSKFEVENNINDKKQILQVDAEHIKVLIENHCDLIKKKLEDTIKTKENIFREEFIKKIDDLIHEQNNNFEKHIEFRYNELFIKNELELKNMLKNVQEKTEKSLTEECDLKCIQNISKAEQMCAENLKKFKKDLNDYAEMFKNQIQSELNVISNESKNFFYKNSEITTNSWNEILRSYKNIEFENVKNNFEQTTENIKRDRDIEIHRFNLEFKEKLRVISEEKLNEVTEQLDIALRGEIDLVKQRVNKNYPHDINIKISKNKLQPKLCIDYPEQESHSIGYQTLDKHNINYSDIKKKIQHCSKELNDALKLVDVVTSTNDECAISPNKCTVSCQTDNIIMSSHTKTSLKEYPYPESPDMSIFNNLSDMKYTDYWNRVRTSEDMWPNHMTTYSQILSPLDILSREEFKVNAAEQNICHLINTFNNSKHMSVYHNLNNPNIYQNKFTDVYQPSMSKQITYNRIKNLREWLYKMDLKKN